MIIYLEIEKHNKIMFHRKKVISIHQQKVSQS